MGLSMVLGAQTDIDVVGEAADGASAIAAAARLRPDVVLMDVRMPGIDGVSATERIIASQPGVRVIVMTTFDLDEHALGALRAGASGFLLKDTPPEDLVSAIRSVAAGDAVVSPRVTRRLISRMVDGERRTTAGTSAEVESLTDREREVLLLIAAGNSNAEIAAHLFLSEATVKTHVGRVLTKLGLRDRVQAVVLAYELGLVTPGA